MSSLNSRIAYLRGLMDGLGINNDSKENKVMIEIVNILDEISVKIDNLEDSQLEFEEYLDTINEDLNDIEEEFYDDDCDYDGCDFDDFVELECPNCSETVYIEEDMLDNHESIKCPNCQTTIIGDSNIAEKENND